ncbi:unnamed protein product [Malus baccata var. baccata]
MRGVVSLKTNENDLKTLSFNDKDKINGKVNSTMIDFLLFLRMITVRPGFFNGVRALLPYNLAFTLTKTLHQCVLMEIAEEVIKRLRFFALLYFFINKTNKNSLKTLNFNDKNKIKGEVNSIRIDFFNVKI